MSQIKPLPFLDYYEMEIPAEDLDYNHSPSGEMSSEEFSFFEELISKIGMAYKPIVIPDPERPGKYKIVDGRHRVKALIKAGYTSISCNVLKEPFELAYVLSHAVEIGRKHLSPEKLKILKTQTQNTIKEYNSYLEKSIYHNLKSVFDKNIAEETLEEIKKYRTFPDYTVRLKTIKKLTDSLKENELLVKPLQSFYRARISQIASGQTGELPPVPSSSDEVKKIQEELQQKLLQKEQEVRKLARELSQKEKELEEKEHKLEEIKKNLFKIKEEIEKKVKEEVLEALDLEVSEEKLASLANESLQAELLTLKKEMATLQEQYVARTRELDRQKKETETLKEQIKKLKEEIKYYVREKERNDEEKETLYNALKNLTGFETLLSLTNSLSVILTDIQNKLSLFELLPPEIAEKDFPEKTLFFQKWKEVERRFETISSQVKRLNLKNKTDRKSDEFNQENTEQDR